MDDTAMDPHETTRLTENMRVAIAIMKLIDDLERMDPHEPRQIEAPALYALARRAAAHGHGADVLDLIKAGLAEGERDRALRDEEMGADGADAASPRTVGHA
jgi:hypothetical protein